MHVVECFQCQALCPLRKYRICIAQLECGTSSKCPENAPKMFQMLTCFFPASSSRNLCTLKEHFHKKLFVVTFDCST
jgi:hypothetical protein